MYSAEKTQWEMLGPASLLLVGKHFLNVKKGIEGTGDLKSNSVNQLETVLRHTCLDHYPRSAICCLFKDFTVSFAEQ